MLNTYEVGVVVKKNGSKKPYSNKLGQFVDGEETITMLHFDRSKPEQARREGQKHGHVKYVRKIKVDKLRPKSDMLEVSPEEIDMGNPFENAIAMDEMINRKVRKRRHCMLAEKSKLID